MRAKNMFRRLLYAFRSRQMFWRILLLYLVGSSLLLAAFSTVLTRVLTQRAADDAVARNQDALSQAYATTDYILNTTYDIYYKLYQSYEASELMFGAEHTTEDTLAVARLLQRMEYASDCVDSVYLINRAADRVYSSNGRIGSLDGFFDGQAMRLFQFYSENSDTLFLPRTAMLADVSGIERHQAYISLIFSRRNSVQIPMGGIIVNIDETAFINKITASLEASGNFFILSENGSILANADAELVNTSVYGSPLWEQVTAHKGQSSFSFTETFKGRDCLVTGYSAPRLRFCFLCVTPVRQLQDSVIYIRNIAVACAAVFLVVALFMATVASRWVYRPISQLVTRLRTQSEADEPSSSIRPPVDEITFLGNTYQGLFDKVETLSQDSDVIGRARRREVLLRLFYGEYPSEDTCRQEAERVGLPGDGPAQAIVILFDDYETLSRQYSAHDLALFRYGLINMAEELLSTHGRTFCSESSSDQVTMLFCPAAEGGAPLEALRALGDAMRQYINCTISSGIGKPVTRLSELVTSYNSAMTASGYRLVFGRGAVIPYEDIARRQTITPEYPMEADGAIVQALRNRSIEKALDGLDAFFAVYSLANLDAINMATTQLTISLSRTVHSVAAGHEGTRQLPNYRVLSGMILSKDTLKERKDVLREYIKQVIEIRNGEAKSKKEDLIDRIRTFIETNYANPLLSTEDIAAFAELSPNYLRTLFKNATGKSPSDYLTECRLAQACDLLTSTDTSTKEIAAAVGYYNHRYFYSVFKSKMGMTATVYRNETRGAGRQGQEKEDTDEPQ